MIHNLTAGHFDPGGAVARPLDMQIVRRLLEELGDADGALGGWKVRYEDGCVILPWKGGGTNRVAEEFAIRLQRATGCALADLEHGRVIEPTELAGLNGRVVTGGARRRDEHVRVEYRARSGIWGRSQTEAVSATLT